ncbi:hypothetical protein [Sphingorhabdus sp. YGSMI21]|uniref:hypothetical protein n=1 Tax=Sphingorhabdus sp. YGSMI21 TaxID=2077182 RepID=UPI000F4F9511|nr:hypothetical protein [Sphingorhabdus sp. YGSMI21]
MSDENGKMGRPMGPSTLHLPLLPKMADEIAASGVGPYKAARLVLTDPEKNAIDSLARCWKQYGAPYLQEAKRPEKGASEPNTSGIVNLSFPRHLNKIGAMASAAEQADSLLNGHAQKVAKALFDSPLQRILNGFHDSPAQRLARGYYDSPATRIIREMQTSPVTRAAMGLRSEAEERIVRRF